MASLNEMLNAGYVPKLGSNFLQKIGQQMQFQQIEQEKQMKKKADLFDMYKTLRSSGYDPKTAWEATLKGTGTAMPTGEDMTAQKDKAELAETQARTDYYKKRASMPDVEVKITESQRFRTDLQKAAKGEIDWEDIEQDWPDRADTINKVKKQTMGKTPIAKSPLFKEGAGIKAFMNNNVANLQKAPKAKRMIEQIKTQGQLDEFMADVDKMIAEGKFTDNDKNTVLEYFGMR